MEAIVLKDLVAPTAGVTGLVLIQSYVKKVDAASKAPLQGVVFHKGRSMNFKIWDAGLQAMFNNNALEGKIANVIADVGSYRDNTELTFTHVAFDHGVNDQSLFYRSTNVSVRYNDFKTFLEVNLSPAAVTVVSKYFAAEDLFKGFSVAWAASKMHDAQVGGLLNHTLKMLELAKTLIANDPRLAQWADLIYISIILHDIGKLKEIGEGGKYTSISYVGHRALGAEMTSRNRDLIVEAFGEEFYYHIIAVQLGHHGQYADKPTTIWGWLVHLIDMLDCHTTAFLDSWESGNIKEKNGQSTVWVGSDYPSLTI